MKELRKIDRVIKSLNKAAARTTDGRVEDILETAVYNLANMRAVVAHENDMRLYHEANERAAYGARA